MRIEDLRIGQTVIETLKYGIGSMPMEIVGISEDGIVSLDYDEDLWDDALEAKAENLRLNTCPLDKAKYVKPEDCKRKHCRNSCVCVVDNDGEHDILEYECSLMYCRDVRTFTRCPLEKLKDETK